MSLSATAKRAIGGGGRVRGEELEKCLHTIYIRIRREREAPPGVSSYAKRIYAFIIRFIMRICLENVYNIYATRINRLFLTTIPSPSVSHTLSGGLFFLPRPHDGPINPYIKYTVYCAYIYIVRLLLLLHFTVRGGAICIYIRAIKTTPGQKR